MYIDLSNKDKQGSLQLMKTNPQFYSVFYPNYAYILVPLFYSQCKRKPITRNLFTSAKLKVKVPNR